MWVRLEEGDVRGGETHLLFEARNFVLGRLGLCKVWGQMGARDFQKIRLMVKSWSCWY